jgi:hypothetical protein
VVEDVRQLPGLGEESGIEKTTQDLVKSLTLLHNTVVYMHYHNIIFY